MNTENMQQKDSCPKHVYATPVLLAYGAVRDLTTGGSKGPAETGVLKGNTRKS